MPDNTDIFQIGELNESQPSFSPLPDMSMPGAFLSLLVESAKKTMNPSEIAPRGSLGWQGMCLRVSTISFNPSAALRDTMHTRNPNKGVSTASEELYIVVKAYIPDLHAGCPLPKTLPAFNVEHEDHGYINSFFPTDFYALEGTQPVPVLGELIWVDYRNPAKLEGGIYNGRVNPKVPQIFFPNSGPTESSKDAFEAGKGPVSIT